MPSGFLDADIAAGQIIAIGINGIWESRDHHGNAYGIQRLRGVLRKYAALSARDILDAVCADIKAFTGGARREDDITPVVAKVGESRRPPPDDVI
jgi:sigma-B regulation protein RsbU (phosphoserine phosphatase)